MADIDMTHDNNLTILDIELRQGEDGESSRDHAFVHEPLEARNHLLRTGRLGRLSPYGDTATKELERGLLACRIRGVFRQAQHALQHYLQLTFVA